MQILFFMLLGLSMKKVSHSANLKNLSCHCACILFNMHGLLVMIVRNHDINIYELTNTFALKSV